MVIGHEVGRALGVRAIFTEREQGIMRLRRGFTIEPGEQLMVVEDVVTTGKSTLEAAAAVTAAGGVVVGLASIVDRSGGVSSPPVPFVAAAQVATYAPEACPLCKEGKLPAIKPGSRQNPYVTAKGEERLVAPRRSCQRSGEEVLVAQGRAPEGHAAQAPAEGALVSPSM